MIHAFFVSREIIMKSRNKFNENFSDTCAWFVNRKLGIYFGEDKTKSIFFASKFKKKKTLKSFT